MDKVKYNLSNAEMICFSQKNNYPSKGNVLLHEMEDRVYAIFDDGNIILKESYMFDVDLEESIQQAREQVLKNMIINLVGYIQNFDGKIIPTQKIIERVN